LDRYIAVLHPYLVYRLHNPLLLGIIKEPRAQYSAALLRKIRPTLYCAVRNFKQYTYVFS
jgi:hypothetical protein